MFRIRSVPDDSTASNASSLRQVQDILRARFAGLDVQEIESLPDRIRDPLKFRFRTILLVAEDANDRVRGFALLLHAPDLDFCYLDFIASAPREHGGGIGSVLYQRVREEAEALGAVGIFCECLPDDERLSKDARIRSQNADRLRFYERFGARPIANTDYETPLTPGSDNPPYLVYDGLGRAALPARDRVRRIVRAILERKYGDVCPPGYIDHVVESFRDDPIVLREPRYVRRANAAPVRPIRRLLTKIPLVVNDQHDIHHVRERGYVEAPVRIAAILREIERTELFQRVEPRRFAESHVLAVHDASLYDYLRRACAAIGVKRSVYPYVFPIRNHARQPKELPLRAGYYCIDTFTPVNGNAFPAARRGVDCTLTAAERVLEGQRCAYALVRPPGHHAERRAFGGFCYFNNAAVAASFLSRYGKVAVLDIDYHHGNGTQDIFYRRRDVLTVSIHGHPSFAYPYFSGFKDEGGEGEGAGYNVNFPLPETITSEDYRAVLEIALRRIARFDPSFLVLAVGFDTAAGDPTGSWPHRAADFARIGELVGSEGYPTVIVQEGGYRVRTLGVNARNFFEGFSGALPVVRPRKVASARAASRLGPIALRSALEPADAERIRSLVTLTRVFSAAEIEVAAELAHERLSHGESSGYRFVMAERADTLLGYACYGPIAGTQQRYDLYWVVVHPDEQGRGLGRRLLDEVEQAVRAGGGQRLYVETSGTAAYERARNFYRRNGFRKSAELADFYRDGDSRVIYEKRLAGSAAGAEPIVSKRSTTNVDRVDL